MAQKAVAVRVAKVITNLLVRAVPMSMTKKRQATNWLPVVYRQQNKNSFKHANELNR